MEKKKFWSRATLLFCISSSSQLTDQFEGRIVHVFRRLMRQVAKVVGNIELREKFDKMLGRLYSARPHIWSLSYAFVIIHTNIFMFSMQCPVELPSRVLSWTEVVGNSSKLRPKVFPISGNSPTQTSLWGILSLHIARVHIQTQIFYSRIKIWAFRNTTILSQLNISCIDLQR